MDPMSIDFIGENSYANHLAFRAPLGTTLETGPGYFNSIHPKVTGSWVITQSFSGGTSIYTVGRDEYNTNVEARFLNSPVVGLRGRVTDKIQIVDSIYPTGSVLSQYIPIAQSFPISGSESPDVNMLEVAFSPQNEINDDIINSLGYFNIGEYIGDPRQVSSSATSYPDLNRLSNDFFRKYFSTYNLFDYIRLIKYFDNSLFKMIKDFVPARTSLTSGIVIKQHLLERNKYPQPQAYKTQYQNLTIYSSSLGLSSSFNYGEDLTYTGSIDVAFMSGSTGGTFNQYNTLISGVGSDNNYPLIYSSSFTVNSVDYENYFSTSPSILLYDNRNIPDQIEFINGEMVTFFYGKIIAGVQGYIPANEIVRFTISSSIQGEVHSGTINTVTTGLPTVFSVISSYVSCSNEEKFSLWVQGNAGTIPTNLSLVEFGIREFLPYSEQTWLQYYTSSIGPSIIINSTQDEFYNGELPGTEFTVTIGELNPENPFKYPTTTNVSYTPIVYNPSITEGDDFLNPNTSPNPGEIYFYKGFTYIKINRIDLEGTDVSSLLEQLQSIIISFNDIGISTAIITQIYEQDTYFTFATSISTNSSGFAGSTLNYSFRATSASSFIPPSLDMVPYSSAKLSSFGSVSGNTIGFFTASNGDYYLHQTPNQWLKVQISGSYTYVASTGTYMLVGAGLSTAEWNNGDGVNQSIKSVNLSPGTNNFDVMLYLTASVNYGMVENETINFVVGTGLDSTTLTINSCHVSLSLYNSSSFDAFPCYLVFNPSTANYVYNDYNPLLDNVDTPESSVVWMNVDYSQNPVIPVNFNSIIRKTAERAFVQDSNYSSNAWSNIRYNGSRTNSFKNI
jgi:hypothetical protein